MAHTIGLNSQNSYEVKVYGQVDDTWLGWFGDAHAQTEILEDGSQVTAFSGVIMDQAALVGLIRRLHGQGIVLLSIVRCDEEA